MRFKKIIAGALTFAIIAGTVLQINAETSIVASKSAEMLLSEENMEISGTNSFGNMVARELAAVSDEQEANNGCNVFSVEISGTTASVSFETLYDSALVVAIYDNEGEQMITSGYKEVTAEETETEVEISGTIPQYFYIRAYLVNPDTLRPLCTEYSSPMYTREMQEFLSKTVYDFDSERVLNLDDNPDTNFAVFNVGTTLIEESDEINILISADDVTQTYIFKNPNEEITSLKAGDVFVFENDGKLVILKTVSLTVDNKTGNATVIGQDADLEEAFEHLRIDGESKTEDAVVDASNLEDGVTFEGLVEDQDESGIAPQAIDIEGKTGYSYKFGIEKSGGTSNNKYSFSAGIDLKIEASAKVYVSFSNIYVQLKLDYSAKIGARFEGKVSRDFPLAYFAIAPVPGVYISLTPSFVVEFDGTASIDGKLYGTVGFKATASGIENLTTTPKFSMNGEIKVSVFLGLSLEPKISIISEKVANAKLTAKVGAEIKAVLKKSTDNTNDKEYVRHECDVCFDGDINAKFNLSASAKLLNKDKWTFTITLLDKSIHLFDFYVSLSYGEFGFTECPHTSYLTELTVSNKKLEKLSDVEIVVDNITQYTTDSEGKAQLWLAVGKHNLNLTAEGYRIKNVDYEASAKYDLLNATLMVKNKQTAEDLFSDISDLFVGGSSDPKDVDYGKDWDLRVKQVSLGDGHSAAVTTDGSLYMWGDNYYGQLGDGTNVNKSFPVKIMENISSISLGGNHSAAITNDGSLYMWGKNDCGQLGDGTNENKNIPVKIMENVSSVSLGTFYYPVHGKDCHSAAITFDGSLYMWGNNYFSQLGDGTRENKNIPVKIMENVSSVSLGSDHSAAITTDRSLYMWGCNDYSQIGYTTSLLVNNNVTVPVKIMENVSSVSLGDGCSAAIIADGNLYMWGNNYYGQLGIGTRNANNNNLPVKVMDNISSVSLGRWYSAATTADGSLYMWGDNYNGQLGDGTKGSSEYKSVPIKIMDNISSVSLDETHSAAITNDGSLYMWGADPYSGIGYSLVPVEIDFPSDEDTNNLNSTPIAYKATANVSTVSTITSLIPNEIYNIYSVTSRTVNKELASNNLIYIGQAVSDASGTLTIPYAAQTGTVFVKAMHEFDVYNAPITSAEVNNTSVSLKWEPLEGASEYEVYCYTTDGLLSQTKTSATSLTINNLEKGKYYGFLITSIIHGEQSVPAIGDVRMVQIPKGILGDINNDTKVTIADARMLLQAASGSRELTDQQKAVADINGDGKITIVDARWLLQVASGSRELDN